MPKSTVQPRGGTVEVLRGLRMVIQKISLHILFVHARNATVRRKRGRPDENSAKARINIFVKKSTKRRIAKEVDPTDRERSSMGKVVDKAFQKS